MLPKYQDISLRIKQIEKQLNWVWGYEWLHVINKKNDMLAFCEINFLQIL